MHIAIIGGTDVQEPSNPRIVASPAPQRRTATARSETPQAADTIVLIHGFWVTPRSWEHWKVHYEEQGYRVRTPAYPGLESEVEALRKDPTPIEQLTVSAIINHLEQQVSELDRPPIIMGHSAGGAFTQVLLGRGYGSAGIAISSAPTDGITVVPLSQITSSSPIIENPANRHRALSLTAQQWQEIFTNTMTEQESIALYERYHVPANGAMIWGSAFANVHTGHHDTYVDYSNSSRAPLLFISGRRDPLFPPKIADSNAAHYESDVITEVVEFDGPHLLTAAPNWRTIADFALAWALNPVAGNTGHPGTIYPSP
ncbi:alpha/beta hydrolase [Agromyces sp. MMS24-JH15]|uniref:alpha/beta hydrolase n=1 Tax=Agromyces sp. MMS24-JH15 TaxID=3243765 RepID=UPI0037490DA0